MSGISPKLPLERDEQDGFSLNKTVIEAVKQNLKMLVLTSPGERVMDPDFGCGIRRLLFEPATFDVKGQVESRIKSQVSRYLPFVNIIDVHFIAINKNQSVANTLAAGSKGMERRKNF